MSNTLLTNFLIDLKKQTDSYEIKQRKLYDELHSSFIFKENDVFIEEEKSPSEKVVIVEEEIDGIGNLEDLPRLVSQIKNSGDLTRIQKPDVSQACRCPLRD